MMYEQPKLNKIGNAKDVILGVASNGSDIDGLYVVIDFEFAEDLDFPGNEL